MLFSPEEIVETVEMIRLMSLDVRCVTLGINLQGCASRDPDAMAEGVREKVLSRAKDLLPKVREVEEKYDIPIINRRISVTPIANVIPPCPTMEAAILVARTLDGVAKEVGIDFIGGYSAMVQKGVTEAERALLASIPRALSSTERVCSSVQLATTRDGINMDAVLQMGRIVKETARRTRNGFGCAKLVALCNAPDDIPFMAGAFHGLSYGEDALNVGVSGPGVIRAAVERRPEASLHDLAEEIKRTAFKITRIGELIGRELASSLGVEFGAVDLSLAPTPAVGDSIARILEGMGLERCGTHGTTAALALLVDAVKKGGAMATSRIGGYSGAFIPVSEDLGMLEAVRAKALSIDKLEAMTSVCSVGLDMIAIPGATSAETIAAVIADEMAIGMVNKKTTAVRLIPVPGKKAGQYVEFGGLFGAAKVMAVNRYSSARFVRRGGRIPPPIHSLTN